jgi:heptosyltransferase I
MTLAWRPVAEIRMSSICILRLSALGDVSHVVPVVRAIQQQIPDAQITWVCGSPEHKIVADIDGVRFVVFEKRSGLSAYRDLRRQLAGERFDTLLHMQVAARANFASAFIKANVRLGWDKARSRDLHRFFVNQRIASVAQQHQVQGFLSFARGLGLKADEPAWDLPVSDASQDFAERVLPGEQPTLLISPCSSHSLRSWSAKGYATVADYAIAKLGMRVALAGGPSAQELATGTAIDELMSRNAVNLIGRDTLPQSLALLRRADIVMSPDAGPVHLANALGTPVIGLYASTWSRRSGPYNSLDLCVDRFPEAARQFRGKEPQDLRWGARIEQAGVMDLIRVDDVIEKLEQAAGRLRQE